MIIPPKALNIDNFYDELGLTIKDLTSIDIDVKVNASVNLLLNDSIYFDLSENRTEEEVLIQLLKIEQISIEKEALFVKRFINHKSNRIIDISAYLISTSLEKSLFIELFSDEDVLNTFIDYLKGRTPNICRNTINILKYINNPLFVLDKLFNLLNNSTITQLYWFLSAIRDIIKRDDLTLSEETLIILISLCNSYLINKEYQIREKVAEIVSVLVKKDKDSKVKNELNGLINVIKKDNVFYVKNILKINDIQGDI